MNYKSFLFIFALLLSSTLCFAHEDSLMVKTVKIGKHSFKIIQQYGKTDDKVLFLNVHEDEITSIETTEAYAAENPIHFIRIAHLNTRRLNFDIGSKTFSVDPNRIYTRKGRRNTLKDGGKFSLKAAKQVKSFANIFLDFLKSREVIIAMHNNTDVNYSIKSYQAGGDEFQNTAEVFVNPEMDPDDFIYTTEKEYYDKLVAKNINVILQDNRKFVNDGSLSVYCGINGIKYINIEAQKGHYDEQLELIKVVMSIL